MRGFLFFISGNNISYIIPGIPPPVGIATASSFLGISATKHSVVKIIEATPAALTKEAMATLAGSITPAANKSSNSLVRALKPQLALFYL